MNWADLEIEKYYGMPVKTTYNKKEKIKSLIESDYYVASLKKDGQFHRYIAGDNKQILQSRGISKKTGRLGEYQDYVPHIIEELKQLGVGNVFLGELYFVGGTTNDVGCILRSLLPKALKRQKEKPLLYYIFDVYCHNKKSFLQSTMQERVAELRRIKEKVKKLNLKYVQVADYVESPTDIRKMLEYARNNEEEGIVMTLKESVPQPGARTAWKTVKIKKELEDSIDVFFTGRSKEATKEYTGKDVETCKYWENTRTHEKLNGLFFKEYVSGETIEPISKNWFLGLPGSLEIGVYDIETKEIIPIGTISGLTEEIKKDYIENPQAFVKRPCLVTAMELTEDYKLRHPKFVGFREDINWQDCTYQKIKGE